MDESRTSPSQNARVSILGALPQDMGDTVESILETLDFGSRVFKAL
jgi:hypothetical protein